MDAVSSITSAEILSASNKFLVFNLINDEEIYNIKYQNKPFMIWIWISAVLLSLGGFVNFLEKRKL